MQPVWRSRRSPCPVDWCLSSVVVVLVGACAASNQQSAPAAATPARSSGYRVHEATDESPDWRGMGLDADHGFLSQDDAEEAIKGHWQQLVACYEQAGPARDFASGAVRLRFLVNGQGRAGEVYILESQLGSLEVERCLTAAGRAIVFPRPQGGKVTTVDYSLEFRSTGEIPVVVLPPGDVARPFASWLPDLAAECHELAVDEVLATFYVDPRGQVRSAGFGSAKPMSEETTDCLSRAIHRWAWRPDRSRAIRRGQVVVRKGDLLESLARSAAPTDRRLTHGRRGGSRR
jgi:hypothetical protein